MVPPSTPAGSSTDADEVIAQEQALLRGLRAGDDAAYEQLVREHMPKLLAVARRLTGNDDDARDVVQDGFLQAFRAIGKFEGNSRIGTWLHRIVVNAALMKLRRARRKPESSIDQMLPAIPKGEDMRPVSAWRDAPSDPIERRETRRLIRASIDKLPEQYRTVLVLRDIEEMDTQEAADLLGISPGAVKTRLHRARLALRELLDPHMQGESI